MQNLEELWRKAAEKGVELYDNLAPDVKEFANQISEDTRAFLRTYGPFENASETQNASLPTFIESLGPQFRPKYEALQKDRTSYLVDPAAEDDRAWIDFEPSDQDVQEILTSDPVVARMFADLVPSDCSELEFFKRFLYRVHLLRRENEGLACLLKADERESDEDLDWGDADGDETDDGPSAVGGRRISDRGQADTKGGDASAEARSGAAANPQASPAASSDFSVVATPVMQE
eukprot:Polyplicarium_translucidae@DN3327_c0_g2_i13.p1